MISSGWFDLDDNLNGGLSRKEMTLFAGLPGTGKSLFLANISKNFLAQGLNVCYITLELAEEVVAKRFDSMFTGIAQTDILKNINDVSLKIEKEKSKYGQLTIKRFPESSTNCNTIRAYLKEFELINGYIPDLLAVDYLDLLASNNKISVENQFIKDKYVSEELRSIANDYNLVVCSASQLGRGGYSSAEAGNQSSENIAGGISKVNTTDNLLAIIQNEQMKTSGEYMLKLLKTRSSAGVGNLIPLSWDPISLTIGNISDKNKVVNFKISPKDDPTEEILKNVLDPATSTEIRSQLKKNNKLSNLMQV
jgi:replicative DNA helicase